MFPALQPRWRLRHPHRGLAVPGLATLCAAIVWSAPAIAQPVSVPPSAVSAAEGVLHAGLAHAVEVAWQRQPQARAADLRRSELDARERAANGLTRDAPALTVENWSDRWTERAGFAKYAGEFALPLWLPGERRRTREAIAADRAYFEAVVEATRLRVAGEVREAYWTGRLADADVAVARLRRDEARTLADDLARRLRAGVVARLDAQSAQGLLQSAEAALAAAESAAFKARRSFQQLTGLAELPAAGAEPPAADGRAGVHPALRAAELAAEAARANLDLVAATRRDSPELGVGMFRERSRATTPLENTVTLRLRIPFDTDQRNAPRLAAAGAQLAEAQAAADLERERLAAEVASARREMDTALRVQAMAGTRRTLAEDNRRLVGRAYALGEVDLPTMLRAQNEFLDAELAVRRAQAEQQRAAARLNQSLGLMP